jgi:predicted RNase H-like nuclease (RuvC/YqgF family)
MPRQDQTIVVEKLKATNAGLKAQVKELMAQRKALQVELTSTSSTSRRGEKIITALQGSVEKLERQLVDAGITPVTRRRKG